MITLKTHLGFYVLINFMGSTLWFLDTKSTDKPTFGMLQLVIAAAFGWVEALGWMTWWFFS